MLNADDLDLLGDDDFDGWEPDLEVHPAKIVLWAIAVAAAPAIVQEASNGLIRLVRAVGEAVRRARLPRPGTAQTKKPTKKGARARAIES